MSDAGHEKTEVLLSELERRIKIEYRQAVREIDQKLKDYMHRFDKKDEKWREWVASGAKKQADYEQWRIGQVAIGERWKAMRDTLTADLMNANRTAMSIARGFVPDVYALNFNYGTYQVEQAGMVDTSFVLYSRDTAARILGKNPQMLPAPGRKVSQAIADGKAERWNNTRIQSVMLQALLQGESIPDISIRLRNAVGDLADSERKAATRNARTMVTGAQNAGRIDAYHRAIDMGIETEKEWIATIDNRTRHAHRELDGVVVPVDEKFENSIGEIAYPGDPEADPSNVWNCRCTLAASVAGWTSMAAEHRSLSALDEGMTYDEWVESHIEKSNPILLPEQKADSIRAGYIREYRGFGGHVSSGRRMDLGVDYDG